MLSVTDLTRPRIAPRPKPVEGHDDLTKDRQIRHYEPGKIYMLLPCPG